MRVSLYIQLSASESFFISIQKMDEKYRHLSLLVSRMGWGCGNHDKNNHAEKGIKCTINC